MSLSKSSWVQLPWLLWSSFQACFCTTVHWSLQLISSQNTARFALLPRALLDLHCLARHFPEAFSEHGLHTWPSKGFSQADQPTRGEQIVSDGGEFFAHTTTTGCIDPNPYFPICSGLGGFSGHATPSLTTSSKNSIILLAPILIFSFVCRLKVTLARGRLQCDLRPLWTLGQATPAIGELCLSVAY